MYLDFLLFPLYSSGWNLDDMLTATFALKDLREGLKERTKKLDEWRASYATEKEGEGFDDETFFTENKIGEEDRIFVTMEQASYGERVQEAEGRIVSLCRERNNEKPLEVEILGESLEISWDPETDECYLAFKLHGLAAVEEGINPNNHASVLMILQPGILK